MIKCCLSTILSCIFLIHSSLPANIHEKLKAINQERALHYWDVLNAEEQKQLQDQIELIDLFDFNAQRNRILQTSSTEEAVITPFLDHSLKGSSDDFALGKQLIADGKVGCLIVAGGQGSRLGFDGPKGIYPVTVVKEKTLFRLFAEKVLAAGHQANRPLLLAIMTSPSNHQETISHFKDNQFFGLDEKNVFFFMQEDLPLLDTNGDLFLESRSRIAAGPDGNAPSLKHFVDKEVWSVWYDKGVRYLNYVPIDNPLADPFDAELIGYHHRNQSEMVIKCIKRDNPLEKLGVLLKKNGRVDVIEYSEISDEERNARDPNGNLWHQCGNISLFSFEMDFVKDIADNHYRYFPYHLAWKAVKYLTPEGETRTADKPMAWKFERFIFDVLPFAQSVKALLYSRDECFAPLKNASGPDSIGEVKAALMRSDRAVLEKVTGIKPDESLIFELDAQFHYPTEELLKNWKGRQLTEGGYIYP